MGRAAHAAHPHSHPPSRPPRPRAEPPHDPEGPTSVRDDNAAFYLSGLNMHPSRPTSGRRRRRAEAPLVARARPHRDRAGTSGTPGRSSRAGTSRTPSRACCRSASDGGTSRTGRRAGGAPAAIIVEAVNYNPRVRTFWRLLGFLRPYRRGVIALARARGRWRWARRVAIPCLTGRAIDAIRDGDRAELQRVGAAHRRSPASLRLGAHRRRAGSSPGASRSASSTTCATASTRTCSRSSSASSTASRPAS